MKTKMRVAALAAAAAVAAGAIPSARQAQTSPSPAPARFIIDSHQHVIARFEAMLEANNVPEASRRRIYGETMARILGMTSLHPTTAPKTRGGDPGLHPTAPKTRGGDPGHSAGR